MSKQVDERVVSMQFDNAQFERNVSTTMSTLDKLKQKLNFTGASKGLEDVGYAAKNVNMSGLSSAVDTVRTKFSAMEVIGVTALANIANSAVNAGKNIIKSLTIDPVKTGFQEYELKMDSVKTIMASTGESIEKVSEYLEELNKYSDQTIYSFSDMTQNIGKFTNAGVKLEDAVMAIKGVSNEAAVSGANANEASRAMYNFAQALSAGYVKLIDWKSIENANMATVEFKNQLIESAVAVGTLTKTSDGMYQTLEGHTLSATQNFNETLQDQWMTTEVLVDTLKDYADETTDIGKKAFAAAQDVTKFTQMMDVLKETAQSGWAQTWELLFGNMEQAKALFTPLTNALSSIIEKVSDFRNKVLEGALGRGFTRLLDDFNSAFRGTSKAIDSVLAPVKSVNAALEDLDSIVNKVIIGSFGNGQERFDALAEAGYNWCIVQNKVNETLGNSYRYSEEAITEQNKLLGVQEKTAETTETLTETTMELTDVDKERIKTLAKMSEEELRAAGYTEEQISALNELKDAASKAGLSIDDFIDNINDINGRWLLIDTFKNFGKSLMQVAQAIKKAWQDIFPPKTIEERAEALFNIIAAVHRFSSNLLNYLDSDGEAVDKLTRTFKGLFAIIDIISTVIGGGFKIAFNIAKQILSYFNLDILDLTAYIGDAIVRFRDWLDSVLDFSGVIEFIIPYIESAANAIKNWISSVKDSKAFQAFVEYVKSAAVAVKDWFISLKDSSAFTAFINFIKNAASSFKEWIETLKTSDNLPRDIIAGLVNGLKSGISAVISVAIELAKNLLEGIKSFLGIHSPSTKFAEVGENIIAGLVEGIQNGASFLWNAMKSVVTKLVEFVQDIDFGTLLAGGISVGALVIANKLVNVLDKFAAPLTGLSDMFSGIGEMFEGIGASIKADAWKKKSKALLNMAIAIGILAASVYVLAQLDKDQLIKAGIALAALAGIMVILMLVASQMDKLGNTGTSALSVLAFAGSLLIIAIAVKKLSTIDAEGAKSALLIIFGMIAAMAIVLIAFGKLYNPKTEANASKIGTMLLKMSVALLIMVLVIKLVSKLDGADVAKGLGVIAAVELLFIAVIAVSKLAGQYGSKAGSMLLKMSIAMLIMVGVIKLSSMMSDDEINKGLAVIKKIGLMFAAFIAVSFLAGKNATKAGTMLLMMSVALAITVSVIRQISRISDADITKGLAVITGISTIFAGIIAVSKFAGANASKAGSMLLKMSVALLILSGVMFILSKIDPEGLGRATAAISVIMGIFGGLIAVTKLAKGTKGMSSVLMKMVIAIGVLSLALVALSFIDEDRLQNATLAISTVMSIFAGLIAVTRYAKTTKTVRKTLILLAGVVVVLAAVLVALSKLAPESVMSSAEALSLLLITLAGSLFLLGKTGKISKTVSKQMLPMLAVVAGLALILAAMSNLKNPPSTQTIIGLVALITAFAGALYILGKTGTISKSVTKNLLPMMAVVAGLALILAAMSFLKNQPSVETAIALSLLLEAFAASLLILSKAGSISKSVTKNLLPMFGIMAGLALILGVMAALNIEASLGNAIALSTLLLAMSAAMVILSYAKSVPKTAVTSMLIMGAVIAELAIILGIMAALNIEASMNNVAALSILLLAMSAALVITSGAGSNAKSSVKALLLMGLVVAELAVILGVLAALDIEPSIGTAVALSILLIGMSMALGILASLHVSVGAAVDAALALDAFVGILAALLVALGGLSRIDGFNELIMDGGNTLALIGEALGKFVGSIVGGVLEGISSGFPEIANNLSAFMTNLQPFIEGAKNIDSSVVEAVGAIAEMILYLTAAELLDQIVDFLGGGESSLSKFAEDLVPFGEAMVEFSRTVDGKINESAVTAAANAGKLISEMQNSIPRSGGWVQDIIGEKDMEKFANSIVPYGEAIVEFSRTVDGKINESAVTAAANAGEMLTSMQDSIPRSGGWVQDIIGEKDMEKFTASIVPFGEAMVAFSKTVDGKVSETAVAAATNAGAMISELQSTIPESGGKIWSVFNGEHDFDAFTASIVPFGEAMVAFSRTVNGKIDEGAVAAATSAGEALAELNSNVPESTAFWGIFGGEHDMGAFSDQIVEFGEGMVEFSETLSGGVNSDLIRSVVETGMKAAQTILMLPDGADFSDLTNGLNVFADGMVDFSEKLDGNVNLNVISTVAETGETLAEMADKMPDEVNLARITNGLDDFATAMVEFSDAVTGTLNSSAISNAATLGSKIVDMVDGIPTTLNLSSFATGLSKLGEAMATFSSDVTNSLSIDAIETAVEAGKKINDFVETIPSGIVYESFSTYVPALGSAIKSFSVYASGGIDYDAVANASDAGVKIAKFVSEIPSYVDIQSFYLALPPLASAIKNFSSIVNGSVDSGWIEAAAKSGTKIADMVKAIPTNVDISSFYFALRPLASAIKDFSSIIYGAIDSGWVEAATNAGTRIAEMVKSIPNDIDISTFYFALRPLASAIKDFSSIVSGAVDSGEIEAATTAGIRIADMVSAIPMDKDITGYISQLSSLAYSISSFTTIINNISGDPQSATATAQMVIETVNGVPADLDVAGFASGLNDLGLSIITFVGRLKSLDASSIGSVTESIKNACVDLAGIGVDSLVAAFTDSDGKIAAAANGMASALADGFANNKQPIASAVGEIVDSALTKVGTYNSGFNDAGKKMMTEIANGIAVNKTVKGNAGSIASGAKTEIRNKYQDFYDAGVYLVDGFADGITAETFAAKAAASAMASAALEAAKEALLEHSPSKAFYRVGEFAGQGFVNAFGDYEVKSYNAGAGIAESASRGLTNAIAKMKTVIETDIDSQPTISPVLDLSNVTAGADAINSMLTLNPSVGVVSNLRAIGSMSNASQNGTNSDVIDAIRELGSKLGNSSGDTYNIDGITYDDGSNIADAIKAIVRQAKIERRS